MKPVTPRQLDVLDFLRSYVLQHRVAPTLRELADGVGCSPVTVREHLMALEKRGLIRRSNGARGIQIIATDTVSVPRKLITEFIEFLHELPDGDGAAMRDKWIRALGGQRTEPRAGNTHRQEAPVGSARPLASPGAGPRLASATSAAQLTAARSA